MSDLELEIIRRRKMMRLRRLMEKRREENAKKEESVDSGEVLKRFLTGRAPEVLEAARLQYPRVTRHIERILADMILKGKIKKKIGGEELYSLFMRLGLRVKLKTHIMIQRHGEIKSLEESVREKLSE